MGQLLDVAKKVMEESRVIPAPKEKFYMPEPSSSQNYSHSDTSEQEVHLALDEQVSESQHETNRVAPEKDSENLGRILTSRHPLAEICRATLGANPAAGKLSNNEKQWIAGHLEKSVLNWLAVVITPESAWGTTCPKGHAITDGIFARQLLGWCCGECEQVYPASDCKPTVKSKAV